eukprot:scaffold803_cov310-Pinguiococcus_pyrenoidosus.AAC.227
MGSADTALALLVVDCGRDLEQARPAPESTSADRASDVLRALREIWDGHPSDRAGRSLAWKAGQCVLGGLRPSAKPPSQAVRQIAACVRSRCKWLVVG